jgi:hypothetical protein
VLTSGNKRLFDVNRNGVFCKQEKVLTSGNKRLFDVNRNGVCCNQE